jgi:hypothetical protein
MKIRIKGNSLRYRLTRPEVEQFGQTGYIEEKIDFVGNSLYYSLCTTDQKNCRPHSMTIRSPFMSLFKN